MPQAATAEHRGDGVDRRNAHHERSARERSEREAGMRAFEPPPDEEGAVEHVSASIVNYHVDAHESRRNRSGAGRPVDLGDCAYSLLFHWTHERRHGSYRDMVDQSCNTVTKVMHVLGARLKFNKQIQGITWTEVDSLHLT